jgi:FMN reductase
MSINMIDSLGNKERLVEGVAPVSVLAIDGSPEGGGRTRSAIRAVSAAAGGLGASVETVGLAEPDGPDRVLLALEQVEAVVIGAPVYRATAAAPLKQLLDLVPRGAEERESPLAAKPVVIVHTGASTHHFLALDSLRSVLAGFFAAHVVPPGLYVPRAGFAEDGSLLEPYASHARTQGAALVELALAIRTSTALAAVRPQA